MWVEELHSDWVLAGYTTVLLGSVRLASGSSLSILSIVGGCATADTAVSVVSLLLGLGRLDASKGRGSSLTTHAHGNAASLPLSTAAAWA